MPEKLFILLTLLLFFFGLFAVSGLSLARDTGPENMELKTVAAKKTARFPHKKHQESIACKECHHAKTGNGVKSPYEEGMQIRKCVTCHNNNDMSNLKVNSYKLAAHGLCKECHKQNRDSAPTKCSGCHIK